MKDSFIPLLIVFLLGLVMLALVFRMIHGSWRRAWCSLRGPCDWQWLYNEPRYLNGTQNRRATMWVGIYRCPRCSERSDGCARWEQRAREVGVPGDEMAHIRDRFDASSA